MRLSPHLLMNDKNFTVYMISRPLANTASELTLAAAGMALAGSYHLTRALVSYDTWPRDFRHEPPSVAAGRLPWAARANGVTIPPLSLTTLPANVTTRSGDSTTLATARSCTVADSRERG